MSDPWSFSLRFSRRPQCPGCALPLNAHATVAVLGWLWCVDCYNKDLATAGTLIHILDKPWVRQHTLWARGLSAYAPSHYGLRRKTILEADLAVAD